MSWTLFDDDPIWPIALLFLTMYKRRRNRSIIEHFEDGIDYQRLLEFIKGIALSQDGIARNKTILIINSVTVFPSPCFLSSHSHNLLYL